MTIGILQIVVSALLTVFGWVIAAWWAVRQVKLAFESNIKLQRLLLRESHRRDMANEIIDIYKTITRACDELKQALFLFALNLGLENADMGPGITVSAKNLTDPINLAYDHASEEIARLDMWLKISNKHVGDTDLLMEAIEEFRANFSAQADSDGPIANLWFRFQGMLAAYKSDQPIDTKAEKKLTIEMNDTLHSVIEKLTEGTAIINQQLALDRLGEDNLAPKNNY